MLEPREIALLQTLGQAARLTADQARAIAQSIEASRAQGGRPNLLELLVARRIATKEEIERFLRGRSPGAPAPSSTPSGRAPAWAAGLPPPPAEIESESPTARFVETGSTERFPPGTPPMALPGTAASGAGGPAGTIRETATRQTHADTSSSSAGPPPSPETFFPGTPFMAEPDPSARVTGSAEVDRATNPQGLGPYRFEARVGDGRSGTVYRARHTGKNRVYAVKILTAPELPRPEIDRLLREARAAQWLRHPNVVAVHEVGESPGGPPFLVTDFIDGPSLAHEIAAGTVDARGAARIVSRVALALQSAHDQAIVHRDVKPSNVLLDSTGEPFLGDFGLAREIGLGGAKGARLVGTPEYAAPEQAAGEGAPPSRQSDIYSLGAVLYECLTGRPPFKGEGAAEVARLVVAGRPTPARGLAPSVPADLEAVCEKALARKPEDRYATSRELAEDLRRFLDGRPVQARRRGRAGGRRGLLVAAAALGALGLVGAGAGGVLLFRRHEVERRVREVRASLEKGDGTEAESRARSLLREEPAEARVHGLLAQALLLERRATDALEEAKLAARSSSDAPSDLVVVARAALACDRPEDARAAYEKALARPGLSLLAEARARAALAAMPEVPLDAARAHLQRVMVLPDKDDPEVALSFGEAWLRLGNPKEALLLIEKARAARPKDDGVALAHALAVAATGDSKASLAELDQLLVAKPDLAAAHLARARLRLALGELAAAFDDADEAQRLGSRAPTGALVAALAKAWLGAREESQSRLADLEKLAPGTLGTALAASQVLALRGKGEDGLAQLSEAIAKAPSALLLLAVRTLLEKTLGRIEPARADAETLLARATAPDARWLPAGEDDLVLQGFARHLGLGGLEASARALHAEVLIQSNRLDDAQREVEAALPLKETAPRLVLAQACLAKDQAAALALAERGVSSCPDVTELRAVRAQLRTQAGQLQPALEDMNALIRLEPANPQYRILRCTLYTMGSDLRSALADIEEAERLSPRPTAVILGQKALLLCQSKRVDDCRRAADRGLLVDPANPECRFARGLARYMTHEEGYDDDLAVAVGSRPDQLNWRLARAQLLMLSGRLDDADRELTDMIERAKSRLAPAARCQLQLMRAQTRVLAGKAREALEDLRLANELVPEQSQFYALRAFARAAVGDEEHVEDVKKVLAQDPRAQELFLDPARIAVSRKLPGPWERHLVTLAALTTRADMKLAALRLVAQAARERGQWTEAVPAAKHLLEVAPNDPEGQQILELARQHGQTP